jgi:uncharacterized protein (TIGR02597 family)
MKIPHSSAFLVLLALAVSAAAAPTGSVPAGCLSTPVTNSTITSFGVPLLSLPTFVGFTTAVGTNTLTVSGVTWTTNQFATAGSPYFVTIRTGAEAGRTLLVTANTANTLTVDPEDTPLNTAGFAITANTDSFELYAGKTLGSLFGATATGGILTSGVQGGTSTATADNIYVPSGNSTVTYYFSTSLNFWVQDGTTTNANNLILYPDDGYTIYRNGATGSLNIATGRVPSSGKLLTKVPGGTITEISLRYPADTTLGALNFGSPGTWITGATDSSADNLGVWNSGGWYWQTYYKNTSNQWIEVGGDGTDQSNIPILTGTALQITKRGTATGSTSFLGQTLPYGF